MKKNPQHPVAVLGLPLDCVSADGAVEAVERLVRSGGTHQVPTVNLDIWLNAQNDPHLHRIIAGCSLVLADGMPLVWASGLLGHALPERVTGVDLVPKLAALSARKGYGIFLLGGRVGVAERAAKLLERDYPGVHIVGTYAPAEQSLAQMDHGEILDRVHAAKPDILLVAFGNPKQEKWIWMHRKRLAVPVSVGVGGSFDILVGDVRRAPRWIQRCGFEWAMRCVQEPARLAPRYMRDLAGLARRLPMALLAAWSQRPYLGRSTVAAVGTPGVMHIYVQGKLGAAAAPALQEAVTASVLNGLVTVVHLQEVKQLTTSGLGVLMSLRRQLLEAGLSLSLAGLTFKLRFLLHAWCAQPLFDECAKGSDHGRSLSLEAEGVLHIDLAAEPDVVPAQTHIRG
jgi:N-acetylglucosaminyldiphosphoundecaprenol N-acetyl-beta-D-mannosaminyltransferase